MFSTMPWAPPTLTVKAETHARTARLWMAYSLAVWLASPIDSFAHGDEQAASNLGQQLVENARTLYGPQEAEFFAGRVPLWGVYIWSLRWMEAESKLASDRLQPQHAVRAHVDRVRRLDKWIKDEAAAGRGWMEQYLESEYYRAVSEAMLSEADTGKPKTKMASDAAIIRLAVAQLIYGDLWTKLQNRQVAPFSAVADWSLAVREAEMALRKDKQSRHAVAEAHLKRMKDMEQMAKQWFEAKKTASRDFALTTFYRADAEVFVSELMDPSNRAQQRRAEAAKLRLDSAIAVYQGTWDLFLERGVYPEFIYECSLQWRNAALAIAKSKADRIAASAAHLCRMEELNKILKKKYDGLPTRQLLACQYYRTEAHVLLQEAKAN
jgi:hypothetical protein